MRIYYKNDQISFHSIIVRRRPQRVGLGSGRFLNVTSRRNGERLDMGIMADAAKIPDVGRVAALLARALETYEAL